MSAQQVIYLALAVATIASGYGVVAAPKLMHSALWLGAAFLGMAGLYVMLEADFLAAAQVLIYVGAITTMILFGIMLSDIRDIRGPVEGSMWQRLGRLILSPRRGLFPLLAALGFAAAFVVLSRSVAWPEAPPAMVGSVTEHIGQAMFDRFVLPFEVASIVLLVALVGAIVLAMREGVGSSR